MTAMAAPMSGPQILAARGWPAKNRWAQKLSGTQAARHPAITRPDTMSNRTLHQFMTIDVAGRR